ncbi:DNA polymerase III subunit chi [Granulosicoccaceae sp. 1_MG-2023]|nr:DNA polymerase III subunit chi [Granulosicoccaceae sp. 1_MG-2023]
MTRIDFYHLQSGSEEARLHFACRLAERAWRSQLRIYIHTGNAERTAALDKLLWTFREDSFLAHRVVAQDEAAGADDPVLLGFEAEPDGSRPVLIQLDPTPQGPVFFSRFKRTLEVINEAPEIKENARQRYLFYKDRGYPLEYHKI